MRQLKIENTLIKNFKFKQSVVLSFCSYCATEAGWPSITYPVTTVSWRVKDTERAESILSLFQM